jgi:DNA-binding SARP family transcriptional activator/predicted ATPase/predicted negative regulator of RcsB-dependent stress response
MLGPLQIALDGQPVGGLIYNKARALLAYLAVEADRPHHRDALVSLLWPDLPTPAARTNLRQVIANLREAIADTTAASPFLHVTRDMVWFNTSSDYELDVAAFVGLLEACTTHHHRRPERCRSCAARLEQALALYRGDFLAQPAIGDSAPFEEWVLLKREWLHQQALDALTQLARYYDLRGAYAQARRVVVRQIELDPWREEAHRHLMDLLARSGQRSAALAQYRTCHRILVRELGVEPSAETTALYEQIRDWQPGKQRDQETGAQARVPPFSLAPALCSPAPRYNFPAQPTALIGREAELAELGALLENPSCRLITIAGPGGIGKTRLALAAATEYADMFAHGAAFVPLAGVDSPAFVAPAILAALGVPLEGQRDPHDQLLCHLRARELLLVLDSYEQLLAGAAFLAEMLRRAPGVTLLVTSRVRLALQAEWLFDLEGLRYPAGASADGAEGYSAVQLFIQRARQVHRHFLPTQEDMCAIACMCRLVEGMPLAIELAAAAVRDRPCAAIASAIQADLRTLEAALQDIPERHRSIWAAFEHSWRLLGEQEQQLLRRLAVFRGGFTLEAAEAVGRDRRPETGPQGAEHDRSAARADDSRPAIRDRLEALVDKSLLRRCGAERYDMHELVRQYAATKLHEANEDAPARNAHLACFVALAEAAAPHLHGGSQGFWLARLEQEHDNLRAALEWSLGSEVGSLHPTDLRQRAELGLRLAGALGWFWEVRGHLSEGRAWLARLLRLAERCGAATALQAQGLHIAGKLAYRQGDYPAAQTFHERSLMLWRALEDRHGIARALNDLGNVAFHRGEYAAARACYSEHLALRRALDDKRGLAMALNNLGITAGQQGDYEAAGTLFEESLAIYRELGDQWSIASSLHNLGEVARQQGMFGLARARFEESLAIRRTLGDRRSIARSLKQLGDIFFLQGDPQAARALYEESLVIQRELGNKGDVAVALCALGRVARAQGDYAAARARYAESLALRQEMGSTIDLASILEVIADLACAQGQSKQAVWLLGAAQAVRAAIGAPLPPAEQANHDRVVATMRASLGGSQFTALWAEGQALTLEQAVQHASTVVRVEAAPGTTLLPEPAPISA